jgi:hypothetical protein
MSRVRIYEFYKASVICALCLSGCSNADRISEDPVPDHIIQADSQTLEEALEKAYTLTLETGRSVAVRMSLRELSEDVKKDQELARQAIETRYGRAALLSSESIS